MSAESYIIPSASQSTERDDDVDSLPSISRGILDSESESDAQQEWEASLEQLQLLLTMVLIPFAGKLMGRQFAYLCYVSFLLAPLDGCFSCIYCHLAAAMFGDFHVVEPLRRFYLDEQEG